MEKATLFQGFRTSREKSGNMIGLEGKNALITGATSGIGQAIAIKAQQGCNIAINYPKDPEAGVERKIMVLQKACGNIENCGVKSLLVQRDIS